MHRRAPLRTGRALARADWRSRRGAASERAEYPLEAVVAALASAIAHDHREFDCGGFTGRRSRVVQPACFYHPTSVDLVNGDDPGGGMTISHIPGPLVAITLDALDGEGRPLRYYDQEQSAAPRNTADFERLLPAERAGAMLQRATALNQGVGIERFEYDEAEAAERPSLLERAWSFDQCQAFNVGAALALRAFLAERRAVLRLPGAGGGVVGIDGIRVAQGPSPPPGNGVHMGFIYLCASRDIGFAEPKLMSATHLWLELYEQGVGQGAAGGQGAAAAEHAAAGSPRSAALHLDFACQQFGLGEAVPHAASAAWREGVARASRRRAARSKRRGGETQEAAAVVRTPAADGPRAWALIEAGGGGGVLREAVWRAEAEAMARIDASAADCGLEACATCRGRLRAEAAGPLGGKRPKVGAAEQLDDPISEELRAPTLWRATKQNSAGAHPCRMWRAMLLAALRETFSSGESDSRVE